MDVVTVGTLVVAIGAILRRPVLRAVVICSIVASAVVCLVLSGVEFRGWWQSFFQSVGVSLLFVGVVNVALAGALAALISTPEQESAPALTPETVEQLRAAMESLERRLAELS
jgi:ABC-type transporter Mla maintaining outer membrane lipid asymmetry permease subunit MlaE